MNISTVENLNFNNESYKNNNDQDFTAKLSGFLVSSSQPIIGLAVVATNGGLLYFYKHSIKASKITLLFLTNLTTSDIIFGLTFCIRFVVLTAAPQYVTQACRFVAVPAAITSIIVSVWSILLISIQVNSTVLLCVVTRYLCC